MIQSLHIPIPCHRYLLTTVFAGDSQTLPVYHGKACLPFCRVLEDLIQSTKKWIIEDDRCFYRSANYSHSMYFSKPRLHL